jgi:hypothetical protein
LTSLGGIVRPINIDYYSFIETTDDKHTDDWLKDE